MQDNPFHRPYPSYDPNYGAAPDGYRHGRGIVHTALVWTAIGLIAVLAFGSVLWVFGLVFHLALLALRIVLIAALVAFVWRRIVRRRR